MRKSLWCLMSVCLVLSACAHRGATRMECDGPLRPINPPMPEHDPVSIAPATTAPNSDHERPP